MAKFSIKLAKTDLYSNGEIRKLPLELGAVLPISVLQRDLRKYIPNDLDITRNTRQDETWQTIAHREYKSSKYYHYILDVNKVFNPFDVIEPGTEIIIPPLKNY